MFRIPLAAVVAALFVAAPALAQSPSPERATVSVTGTGEVELKPNFARISVMVGTQADTVAQAVDANRTASERVLARIQALGVKRDDIRTANFSVFQTPPRVGRNGEEIKVPRFTANHQLNVITRDIDGVGRLSGEILASGDMTFQSLSWGLDRQEEGGDGARRAAVGDAKRQAEVYAAAAGIKLGRLVAIRDGSVQAFDRGEADIPMRMSVAKSAEAIPVVPPATIRYTASVQLVFEIAP